MVANKKLLEARVEAFRSLVYTAISKAAEAGKVVKPYDGQVSLTWPALVHTHTASRKYAVRLSCSVLGGESSHFVWRAHSWKAAFASATADVEQWIADLDKESDNA